MKTILFICIFLFGLFKVQAQHLLECGKYRYNSETGAVLLKIKKHNRFTEHTASISTHPFSSRNKSKGWWEISADTLYLNYIVQPFGTHKWYKQGEYTYSRMALADQKIRLIFINGKLYSLGDKRGPIVIKKNLIQTFQRKLRFALMGI